MDHSDHKHDADGNCITDDKSSPAASTPAEGTVVDPVCGMSIAPDADKPSITHKGKQYHFCSDKCHDKFEADPETYVAENTVTDPVCGMNVPLDQGKPTFEYNGETQHFCSDKCHDKFEADPYFYASGKSKLKKKAADKKALYTCPMHPEVIQEGPGACPICGMALEAAGVATDEPNEELIDFTRRFWVSATAPLPQSRF